MSHLLYLHSVAGDPKSKRKPLSEMGLGKPVLEAWAPRFKTAGAQAWLAMLLKDDGPVTLTPTRVAEFAAALVEVAALEAPPLKCGKARGRLRAGLPRRAARAGLSVSEKEARASCRVVLSRLGAV